MSWLEVLDLGAKSEVHVRPPPAARVCLKGHWGGLRWRLVARVAYDFRRELPATHEGRVARTVASWGRDSARDSGSQADWLGRGHTRRQRPWELPEQLFGPSAQPDTEHLLERPGRAPLAGGSLSADSRGNCTPDRSEYGNSSGAWKRSLSTMTAKRNALQ